MTNILITGGNRGIGFGLISHYIRLPSPPKLIIAPVRDLAKATNLLELSKSNPTVHVIQSDITKFDQLPQLFDKVANLVKDDGLNVIINNAGICSSSDKLEQIEMADFDEHMLVNVKVPLMMTKTMLPLLKRAAEDTYGWIVNMTSVLGSIAANSSGGYYTYRASKAALNAVTKNLSVELKHDRILSVMLHPGWVQTDMGGAGADITIEQSCSGLINIITHLQPNQNGKFYQYNGQELPW